MHNILEFHFKMWKFEISDFWNLGLASIVTIWITVPSHHVRAIRIFVLAVQSSFPRVLIYCAPVPDLYLMLLQYLKEDPCRPQRPCLQFGYQWMSERLLCTAETLHIAEVLLTVSYNTAATSTCALYSHRSQTRKKGKCVELR